MRSFGRMAFGTLCAACFALLAPGITPPVAAQNSVAEPVAQPAPQAKSAKKAPAPASSGSDWAACSQQLQSEAKDLQREFQTEWPKVQAEIQAEMERERQMSGPEMAKLRDMAAQLRDNQGQYRELMAQAEVKAARARQLADAEGANAARVAQAQVARVFASRESSDEGWLGVEIGEVTAKDVKDLKLSSERGVIVSSVAENSPAAKAGLKQNDVIMQYNGESVEGGEQFRRLVRETPPHRTISMTVSRNGKMQTLSLEVGERSGAEIQQLQPLRDLQALRPSIQARDWSRSFASPGVFVMNARTPILGIEGEDLSGQLGAYFDAPHDEGVLVRYVTSASPAEKAGLKAGDVIISANGTPVKSLADLRNQLPERNIYKAIALPLGIIRRGSQMSVSVTLEPRQPEPPPAMHTAQL